MFRSKNKNWDEYMQYVNKVRFHNFGMRDLGRGLAVLYHGHGVAPHLPDGIQPTFTPKLASMCLI